MKDVSGPEKPEENTLKGFQTVIAEHLSPASIIIAERYMFYNRKQLQVGEKVVELSNYLRRLASSCAFHENYREDVL